jgi:two-component system response regulator DesR
MKKIRVLCIDDSEFIAAALARRLRIEEDLEWGGWVSHPSELGLHLASPPDVVLVDIDMPGVDSFALLREVKEKSPDAHVAVLTGHVRRDYFERAVEAGSAGYLCKDDDPGTIVRHIRRLAAGEFVVSADLGFEEGIVHPWSP